MKTGKVLSVNVSVKRGTVKHAVNEINLLEDFGVEGDSHAEKGSIRQVSLLGQESVDKMTALGVPGLCFGKFAENITTEGIVLFELPVGTQLKIGKALTEVTQIGKKCHAADGCEIARTVGICVMPKEGIFVKVISGGIVRAGDIIEVIS
jgi:Uncharacterized protein conserved in bacteria